MANLQHLIDLGQSIWYENTRPSFLNSQEARTLLAEGVSGFSANFSSLAAAILDTSEYDSTLRTLLAEGLEPDQVLESLLLAEARQAATLLQPIFERTRGASGYVSFPIDPRWADVLENLVTEAWVQYASIECPNGMVQVPATHAGIQALERLIGQGVNVHVSLIYTRTQYRSVADAYLSGLERLAEAGGDLSQVASVAAVVLAPLDAALDPLLEKKVHTGALNGAAMLLGKIAIANARLIYQDHLRLFRGERWAQLAALGARPQPLLWTHTHVHDPVYPETLYLHSLIGPRTIPCLSAASLQAYLHHAAPPVPTLEIAHELAMVYFDRLAELEIDFDSHAGELFLLALEAETCAQEEAIAAIQQKARQLDEPWQPFTLAAGPVQAAYGNSLAALDRTRVLPRIWALDHTVWAADPTGLSDRLGWLHITDTMRLNLPALQEFALEAADAGLTHAVLLGMGGSSLAPEVFEKTYGVAARAGGGRPAVFLEVLDSTAPGAVLALAARLDPARTLFIVSTKSGGTVETFSFFEYFYAWVSAALGPDQAGAHFAAITDPGSKLEDVAYQFRFRAVFLDEPRIGGRFSALSFFGLVPAALVGVDMPRLLSRAEGAAAACSVSTPLGENPAAQLGALIGEAANVGRDKLTLLLSPGIASFGDWVEQLVAESLGKSGKGVTPIIGELPVPGGDYGRDRLFVYLRLDGDSTWDGHAAALEGAGFPLVRIRLRDAYDLGGQFFLWEMATAVAGHLMGIHPFNQPNVEAAKVLAREMVAAYQREGKLPALQPTLQAGGVTVYAPFEAETPPGALEAFLALGRPGDYVALQAYVPPTAAMDAGLSGLRAWISSRTHLATTVGYGPRFLHSTGQLHKGDSGRGLFVQITADAPVDAPIPNAAGEAVSGMTFGVLIAAQSLGDRQALLDGGRRVLRLHFSGDPAAGVAGLVAELA